VDHVRLEYTANNQPAPEAGAGFCHAKYGAAYEPLPIGISSYLPSLFHL
jgi:hypothetical protein